MRTRIVVIAGVVAALLGSEPTSAAGASDDPSRQALVPARHGNPFGQAVVPDAGAAVDTSTPTRVVGTGTPQSCTSSAVVAAVAAGGIITFSCGPAPVTIGMRATAKVLNTTRLVVLDGGGLVTLSGLGRRRILYQNTCDPLLGPTTWRCVDQETPKLVVQNLTFADGNSTGRLLDGGGGGAIFVRGGQFKVRNSRFVRNRCDPTGPDLGGAAIRVLEQYQDRPVYIVQSTFDSGVCSNGGALSSIDVSWAIFNSVMTRNSAIGYGANPAKPGTPGGGSGGAIYLDGDRFTLRLYGTVIERNQAREGGGAIFFVSNNRTGTMSIQDSRLRANRSDGFETPDYPGIFFLGAEDPTIVRSILSR